MAVQGSPGDVAAAHARGTHLLRRHLYAVATGRRVERVRAARLRGRALLDAGRRLQHGEVGHRP